MQRVPRQRLSLVRQWQSDPGATRHAAAPAAPTSGPAPTASCPLRLLLARAEYAFRRSATIKLIFVSLWPADAGQDPARVRLECNSPHRLPVPAGDGDSVEMPIT